MKLQKENFITPILTVFVTMAVSCSAPDNNKISDGETALQVSPKVTKDSSGESSLIVFSGKDTVITGPELFRRNCAGCHGLNREGSPPVFPSLLNIKDKMGKEQIYNQIKNGKGLMISHAFISDNEINAIIAYLFNEPNQPSAVINYSLVDVGKNIVMSNCVGCHRLTVNDPPPPNVKALCPLIEPVAFAGEAKKQITKEQFYLILKTGPCYMPSFDFLTTKEKEAVWIYLKTLI